MSKTIGQRIVAYRIEREISLTELAERAGIGKATLHAIENRPETRPSAEVLYAIAKELGVTMEVLMDKPALATPAASEHALHELFRALKTENTLLRHKLRKIGNICLNGFAETREDE